MNEGDPRIMLRALSGPLAGATFEVGPRVLIGRIPVCDILIADVEVSREHAMIVIENGRPTLVDLDSRNGTYVRGQRVTRVPLEPGVAFTISGSEFMCDRVAPISTTPVLSLHFANTAPSTDSSPTRELARVDGEPPITSGARRTRASLPIVPPEDPPEPIARPTVRLEAASAPEERATAELRVVSSSESDDDPSARSTVSLAAVEPPPSFEPPPLPTAEVEAVGDEAPLDNVDAEPHADAESYVGDLFADVTTYRAFRLRLQRGEIPSGTEVAAMIDLEAALRELAPESTPRRDVVSQRFFRRFPFRARVSARFSRSGRMVELVGEVVDLSVDGVRCALQPTDDDVELDQLAMLVIDHTRGGTDVRYSITARAVRREDGLLRFTFAGVPSWVERGAFEDADTAVRSRPV